MNLIDAVILGIVEGFTEFLPISSTGHLILTSKLLGLTSTEFLKSFEIAIQLGAIAAVVGLYGRSFLTNFNIMKKVLAAFIPTAILGLVLYKIIKGFLLGNSQVVLWSFFLGGIFLIVFDLFHREDEKAVDNIADISYATAAWIGVFQALAMIPGVSRAAATIIGGLILGLKRRTIVEFSFLLAIPTMLAATGLDLLKTATTFSNQEFLLLGAGLIVSFLVALLGIRFLLKYIQNHNFVVFGIYRIAVAVLFWVYFKPA